MKIKIIISKWILRKERPFAELYMCQKDWAKLTLC